jgi:hypothetical protein
MASTTHEARIELALADLGRQERPNIMGTAKKFSLIESTLRRRFQGKTLSRAAATSEYRQNLTFAQEEILISQINRLTDRGLPPTNQIVKNFAEEILGRSIGKNWAGDFVKRYKGRLTSLYLENIDRDRTNAEYAPIFKQFYDLVISNYIYIDYLYLY